MSRMIRKRFWLIMRENGAPRIVSTYTHTPNLQRGEICVLVSVDVPESLWHPPVPQVSIKIPESNTGPAATVTVPRETAVIAIRVSDHPEATVEIADHELRPEVRP